MGRRQGARGAYLERYVTDEQRGRRHFHRNPLGRQLAVFPRLLAGPDDSDMGASLAP